MSYHVAWTDQGWAVKKGNQIVYAAVSEYAAHLRADELRRAEGLQSQVESLDKRLRQVMLLIDHSDARTDRQDTRLARLEEA